MVICLNSTIPYHWNHCPTSIFWVCINGLNPTIPSIMLNNASILSLYMHIYLWRCAKGWTDIIPTIKHVYLGCRINPECYLMNQALVELLNNQFFKSITSLPFTHLFKQKKSNIIYPFIFSVSILVWFDTHIYRENWPRTFEIDC